MSKMKKYGIPFIVSLIMFLIMILISPIKLFFRGITDNLFIVVEFSFVYLIGIIAGILGMFLVSLFIFRLVLPFKVYVILGMIISIYFVYRTELSASDFSHMNSFSNIAVFVIAFLVCCVVGLIVYIICSLAGGDQIEQIAINILIYLILALVVVFVLSKIGKIKYDSYERLQEAKLQEEHIDELNEEKLLVEIDTFGTETLSLRQHLPYKSNRALGYVDEQFQADKDWSKAMVFETYENDPAYGVWRLEGKFATLEFQMLPYNIGNNCKGEGEVVVADYDTGIILAREAYKEDSLPKEISVDVTGVSHVQILSIDKNADLANAYVVINDGKIIPLEDSASINSVSDNGASFVNLKDIATYNESRIDLEPKLSFDYQDRVWNNIITFDSYTNGTDAYATYELNGEYSELTFQLLPYAYDFYFDKKSEALFQVINADTEEVLYSEKVKNTSGIIDVNVDISDVKYLKILSQTTKGDYAYCIINNPQLK